MTVETLFLDLQAPFSAYRWLQAGVYRGSFPVIPHSAAWGLCLNLAGVETRGSVNQPVTDIRPDAPTLEVAVGIMEPGQRSTLYQQLHGYPVGSAGKELQARTHGAKYWIAPVKREFLVGLRCVVGVRGTTALISQIPRGLRGEVAGERYGLPFAGDNQLLFDRIDVLSESPAAQWFLPARPGETRPGTTRLTTNIDRSDSSRTEAPLFVPASSAVCPEQAWVPVGPGA